MGRLSAALCKKQLQLQCPSDWKRWTALQSEFFEFKISGIWRIIYYPFRMICSLFESWDHRGFICI
jgi:hypothetical protein